MALISIHIRAPDCAAARTLGHLLVVSWLAAVAVGCLGDVSQDGAADGAAQSEKEPSQPNPDCQLSDGDDGEECPRESEEICAAIGYECGKTFANIGCSDDLDLVDCGGCPDGYQCVEGSCACPESYECGGVEDACGGSSSCGECESGFTCGDDNTCYCEGESDEELCERLEQECGTLEAEDVCGSEVTADCGGCGFGVCTDGECDSQVTLEPSDVPEGDSRTNFGLRVAAGEGFVAVSERELDASGVQDAGAVQIFERQDDGSWEPTRRLRATDPVDEGKFGQRVVASDEHVFVGAQNTDRGDSAVFVFEASSDWEHVQTLRPPVAASERGGIGATTLLPDGRLAVASMPDGGSGAPGRVDVFEFDGDQYQPASSLEAPSELALSARFGMSVVGSEEYLFVGADRAEVDGSSEVGVVYAFFEDGDQWSLEERLEPPETAQETWFGHRLAWASDSLLVAASHADHEADSAGAVYVFEEDGGFEHTQTLGEPEPTSSAQFGHAMVARKDYAVVNVLDKETAVLFHHESGQWQEVRELEADEPESGAWFGFRQAFLPDAVVVGEPRRGQNGAVRLFGLQ